MRFYSIIFLVVVALSAFMAEAAGPKRPTKPFMGFSMNMKSGEISPVDAIETPDANGAEPSPHKWGAKRINPKMIKRHRMMKAAKAKEEAQE